MTNILQNTLVAATKTAADDLHEAFSALPLDKRLLVPSHRARSSLFLMTGCVLRVGLTADALRTGEGRDWQRWPEGAGAWDHFRQEVASAAALGWEDHLMELLSENAAAAASAIAAVPQEALGGTAEYLWGGKSTLAQMMTYPLLDMNGCANRIYCIVSLLGLLE